MYNYILGSFLIFSATNFVSGELTLSIYKKTEDTFYPVGSKVEENAGTAFALVCELVSTDKDKVSQFDDRLSWIRGDKREKQLFGTPSDVKEINKSIKKFEPLKLEDNGSYVCISEKFKLVKVVQVIVSDEIKRQLLKPARETLYCNEHMFQCLSDGVCISQHYACDGKPDCKDKSDESVLKCGAFACKDKVPCDEGRCIPASWCCDRHHDPNCTVTNILRCCQGQSDSYEEMELGFPTDSDTQHTARYLFILVCVVSILFSVILLLLIISKVVIFAKKAALQQQQARMCEGIALRNQTNINVIPCGVYAYRSRTPRLNNVVRNIIIDSSDVADPLLFNPSRFNVMSPGNNAFDQPPSYVDALRNNRGAADPPPPYRSQENVNCMETGRI